MKIDKTAFKNEIKKLKKYVNEQKMLERILLHIKESSSYEEMVRNPISRMYGSLDSKT